MTLPKSRGHTDCNQKQHNARVYVQRQPCKNRPILDFPSAPLLCSFALQSQSESHGSSGLQRNGKKNLRATTWAVTEPTDSPPGSPRAASSTSWAASSTPGTKSTFAFPKSQTSKSQQKPSSAPGKKPAQPKGTPQIILDRVLRVISMGPWRAPPDLMDNITRQLPEQPPRGNSARQAWHGEYAHKEMALGMLRGVLSTRRDTVTPCLRGLGLSETHQEESNTCAVKYDELLDKFALMQSQVRFEDVALVYVICGRV